MKAFVGYLVGFAIALVVVLYWLGTVIDALQTGLQVN